MLGRSNGGSFVPIQGDYFVKASWPARMPWLLFGLASVAALAVVFVGFRAQGLVDNRPDPYWFSAMGTSLARGEGLSAYGSLLHRRAPLYPFMIGGIYTVFGEHPLLVQLVQIVLFAGTSVIAFELGRRIYNVRTGIIAGALCAVHPALLRYVADFHLETLFTFLLTLSVLFGYRFYERPSVGRAAAFGVLSALTALTKSVAVLFPPLFLLLWWISLKRTRSTLPVRSLILPVAVLFGTMALTISPWTIRNYAVTGHFVPISTGFSDAFLRGYVFSKTEFATLSKPPYTDGENESNAMFQQLCAAEGAVWEQDDYQTDQILNRAAKARLLADPGAFVRKTVVGLFTFWYEMTSLKNSLAAGAMALIAWLFAAVGLWRSKTERQPAWILLVPILYFNLILAPLLALGRYSVPIVPCLIVLAAFGVDTLWDKYLGRAAAR
ncbi:MAG TPA: glycosyltransferase family 39 protein [Polyangiaceae bacterium]|nr:glycosyltransferase family 39 protein [Polyangiaceae bacterium]